MHRQQFRLAALIPLLFFPSVSALKHTSSLTPLTPQSQHTHATKQRSHTLHWVRGRAELSHTSSHWQHVCRVCNGPTGELILLTSRVRNFSSSPRERGNQGQLNTHTHTPPPVNTYTYRPGQSHLLTRTNLDRFTQLSHIDTKCGRC